MTDTRRRWTSGLAVVVAGAAAFVVGSSLTPDPAEPAGRSVAIGVPTVALDEPPLEVEAVAETSSTTTPNSTTTVAPRPLSTSISDWDYAITWATESTSGPALVRLLADADKPERFELPRSAGQFEWNASATLLAYVDNRVLYVGPPGAAEPLAIGVQHVAWHQTDEYGIAWTENPRGGGNAPPTIAAASLSDVGALLEAGVPLPIPHEVADGEIGFWSLLAWGNGGFLVARESATTAQADNEAGSDVMLLSLDGSLRRIIEERAVLLFGAESAATYATQRGASLGELIVVDLDGEERPIELDPGQELIALNGEGESWVAIGPGDTMTAVTGEAILRLPIAITVASWTDDGNYLVVVGQSGELGVIDAATGERLATTNASVGGALWNLRVHSSTAGE